MSEIYFTIAGTNHWHGQEFIEPQMKVKLVKEPDNEVDSEAIKVEMPGIGQIGYVANSPYTVILSEIEDPAMRKLAIDQLKCIARIS